MTCTKYTKVNKFYCLSDLNCVLLNKTQLRTKRLLCISFLRLLAAALSFQNETIKRQNGFTCVIISVTNEKESGFEGHISEGYSYSSRRCAHSLSFNADSKWPKVCTNGITCIPKSWAQPISSLIYR